MAGYTTIKGEMLDYDPRVERLSDGAYRLFMLTLYSRGRTLLGLMRFVPADVVPRVRGWDEATAAAALEELIEAGLVEYDPDRRVLFNPAVIEHSPVRGSKSVKGGWTVLTDLPDSPVIKTPARKLFVELQVVLGDESKQLSDKNRRELEDIAKALEARLAGLEKLAQASPMDGASMGLPRGIDGVSMAHRRPFDGASMGHGRGIDGASGETEGPDPVCGGHAVGTPTCSSRASPSDGASMGHRRGIDGVSASRARLSVSERLREDPPYPPAAGSTGQDLATKSGKERKGSRYGNLGQGKRD